MVTVLSLSHSFMAAWALNLKGAGLVGAGENQCLAGLVRQSKRWSVSGGEEGIAGILNIRVSEDRRRRAATSIVVRAAGKKKNNNNPSPSGDDDDQSVPKGDGSDGINPLHDESTYKSRYALLDWREFRAKLVAQQQVQPVDSDAPVQDPSSHKPSPRLGLQWAHPISSPETGCVLVATEKLDGSQTFERTVVLLLRPGTKDPGNGPFGIIINRPMCMKMKHMEPSDSVHARSFADSSLNFGGPLDTTMFLVKARENPPIHDFEQVVRGICFGSKSDLSEAAVLVKKGVVRHQDFRFFVGYAGWQTDQLRQEIEAGYWIVAACSSYLIGKLFDHSSPELWEDILQVMGGEYAELSRKPKLDSL